MKRKIIKLGESTLVTSLPSKWTKKFGLKQGDEVEVEEKENRLVIATKKEFASEKKLLDITHLGSMINYSVLAVYLRGVDEVRIKSDKPEYIRDLQQKPLKDLIGYEIIEQGKDYCMIKDVSGAADMDLEMIMRRIFLIINSMSDEIQAAVEKGGTDLAYVDSIDKNANRFAFLCLRKLNKSGYGENHKTSVTYFLILMLERIGDLYSDLAEYIAENKVLFNKDLIEMLRKVNNFYKDYQQIFFKFDQDKAAKLDSRYREMKKEFNRLFTKIGDKDEMRALIYMSNIADYVAEMLRNQLVISL